MRGGHHFFVYPKGGVITFSVSTKGGHVFLWGVLLVATAPSGRNNERSLSKLFFNFFLYKSNHQTSLSTSMQKTPPICKVGLGEMFWWCATCRQGYKWIPTGGKTLRLQAKFLKSDMASYKSVSYVDETIRNIPIGGTRFSISCTGMYI